MNTKSKLVILYGTVALISAAILGTAMWVRSRMPRPEPAVAVATGKQTEKEWFPIERDLTAVNQAGETVKLSQLKGKVWLVAEFFAVCPHCAMRNGAELRVIYDAFKANPDFQMVCISVDPKTRSRLAESTRSVRASFSLRRRTSPRLRSIALNISSTV